MIAICNKQKEKSLCRLFSYLYSLFSFILNDFSFIIIGNFNRLTDYIYICLYLWIVIVSFIITVHKKCNQYVTFILYHKLIKNVK